MANVQLVRFLDRYFGSLACFILSFFSFRPKKRAYKKILLIQLWGLGETILSLPAIKELKNHNKKAAIDVLTTKRVNEVFYNNKNIDKVSIISLFPLSFKLFILKNLRKYDLVIDMEEYLNTSAIIAFYVGKERIGYSHGIRSRLYTKTIEYNDKQHTSQTFMDLLKPLGIKKKVKDLERLSYSAEDKKNANNILKSKNISGRIITLSPGAAESARFRMWPEERWAGLVRKINKKYNLNIVLVGTGDVRNLNQRIIEKAGNPINVFNIAGGTSTRELFALMEKINLMVSIDSGPMHVAAAQKVKTIGLFGPNTPIRFAPLGKNTISIYKTKEKPVINVHKGQVPSYSSIDFMGKISVSDVMKAVDRLMKSR